MSSSGTLRFRIGEEDCSWDTKQKSSFHAHTGARARNLFDRQSVWALPLVHRESRGSLRSILRGVFGCSIHRFKDLLDINLLRRKYSLIKTKIIAGRIPVDVLNEIHKFKGSNTYHLERALKLYVKVMKETA